MIQLRIVRQGDYPGFSSWVCVHKDSYRKQVERISVREDVRTVQRSEKTKDAK